MKDGRGDVGVSGKKPRNSYGSNIDGDVIEKEGRLYEREIKKVTDRGNIRK